MIVCHCTQATDRTICAAATAGCRTADEVAAVCGAGARCGGCQPLIQELLDQAHATAQLAARPEASERPFRLPVYTSDVRAS